MKAIVTGAAVVLVVLLFVAFLLSFLGKPPQDITVRHVENVQSHDFGTTTFEIANHTTSRYVIYPLSVEVRNGQVWKKCFDFSCYSFPMEALGPHSSKFRTFATIQCPTGFPLRLRMSVGKELAGLEAMFERLDLRLRRGLKHISINPFEKTAGRVFLKYTEIVSDEFFEPEAEPTSKAKSDK